MTNNDFDIIIICKQLKPFPHHALFTTIIPNYSKQCMSFLIKVPETLDVKMFMHPVTIMTRAPPMC